MVWIGHGVVAIHQYPHRRLPPLSHRDLHASPENDLNPPVITLTSCGGVRLLLNTDEGGGRSVKVLTVGEAS
jgi:hypothetical protein